MSRSFKIAAYKRLTKEKALRRIRQDWRDYHLFPHRIQADLDVFMAAVREDWTIAHHLPEHAFESEESMKQTILKCLACHEEIYAHPPGWLDPKFLELDFILREALPRNGLIIQYIPEAQTQRAHALTAVRQNGDALHHLGTFQDDKEIVLLAAQKSGTLGCASKRLQDDPEVVLAAVQVTGDSLYFASTRLRSNKPIVLAACRQNHNAFNFTPLENDPHVVCAALAATPTDYEFDFTAILQSLTTAQLHDYCRPFALAHPAFVAFVLGTKAGNPAKLREHGIHFFKHFKNMIADYLVGGDPNSSRARFSSRMYAEALAVFFAIERRNIKKRRF